MKIGIVILNYINYKILLDCISSLKKQDEFNECEVVIVDNNSPNDSFNYITSNIKGPNIHCIKNKTNSGYAQGNNIGFHYLKNVCKCKTIIVMNSDVILENRNFLKTIRETIGRHRDCHIIAPDVINISGIHSNPFGLSFISKKDVSRVIFRTRLSYFCLKIGLDLTALKNKKNNKQINNSEYHTGDYFIPHGSCIIFTPLWTELEDRCFFPNTFLFCEENILVSYIISKGYRMIYEPSLQILHKEDGSLNAASKTARKKKLFVRKCQLSSLKKYRSFMKKPLDAWSNCEPFNKDDIEVVP